MAATIRNYTPELLTEALHEGVSVIPNPLDESVLESLQRRIPTLSWEPPEYGEYEGWHRSKEVVLDSSLLSLRNGTLPVERAVMQGLKVVTRSLAQELDEPALFGWGKDTFGLGGKLAKKAFQSVVSETVRHRIPRLPAFLLDTYHLTMRYHRIEAGGFISPHTDSEDLQGVEYVLVVDQDEDAAEFKVQGRSLEVKTGDIVVLAEAMDPADRELRWPGEYPEHSLANTASADKDRITAIFGYERVAKYLLETVGQ